MAANNPVPRGPPEMSTELTLSVTTGPWEEDKDKEAGSLIACIYS